MTALMFFVHFMSILMQRFDLYLKKKLALNHANNQSLLINNIIYFIYSAGPIYVIKFNNFYFWKSHLLTPFRKKNIAKGVDDNEKIKR